MKVSLPKVILVRLDLANKGDISDFFRTKSASDMVQILHKAEKLPENNTHLKVSNGLMHGEV